MSDLPASNTGLDGIIRWTQGQLGRHPTEGEITVVRVAMEMRRRRQQDREDRRKHQDEAAFLRRRRQDQEEEEAFQKKMRKEIADDYIFAICLIYFGRTTTDWTTPAIASKTLLLKTDPLPIIDGGMRLKAQETNVSFEPTPDKRHRALLSYIVSKMPDLAPQLPPNPPHHGVDNPRSFYDMTWQTRASLHPHHQYLINGQTPERIKAIFQEVAASYPYDSGPLMHALAREGELAIPALKDYPAAFAFTPTKPPLSLLPEPPKPDPDDIITPDTEGPHPDDDDMQGLLPS